MSCQENCATAASIAIGAAWNEHTEGKITLDELWEKLQKIESDYNECVANCGSNP